MNKKTYNKIISLVEIVSELEELTGYSVEKIRNMVAAGWVLTLPEEKEFDGYDLDDDTLFVCVSENKIVEKACCNCMYGIIQNDYLCNRCQNSKGAINFTPSPWIK